MERERRPPSLSWQEAAESACHESVSAESGGAMAEGSAVGVEASRAPLAASHSWTVTERDEPTSGAAHDQPTTRPRFLSSRGWAVKATPRPRLAST